MTLRMEPGQTYDSWADFKDALDAHCREHKVIFNIANAKTAEASNSAMKRGPFYDPRLKYAHCILQCKHYGSYTSSSVGLRPKQRSYKINCKAFISISACRKENYLIVRDSYHKHSHPCSEEIYNSYPEVRRMTKDERRMVGHLLDLGVPMSQIKSAVGRNVTPKDLHNAKNHMKAIKMGLKNDEPKSSLRRRRTHKEMEKARRDARRAAGDVVTDSEEESNVPEAPTVTNLEKSEDSTETQTQASSSFMKDNQESIQDESGKDLVEKDSHESDTYINSENPSNIIVGAVNDEKDGEAGEKKGLSGLLAAAGSVDALDTGPDEDGLVESKTSYTVIVSSDGNMEMAQTSSNLQDLLKKVKEGRMLKTKAIKPPGDVRVEGPVKVDHKNCENCGKYMSPLDGHSLCIVCLGPQHLHSQDCEHCAKMKPEQLNIRRKVFVRMRMKALKERNETKQQNPSDPKTQSVNEDDQIVQARRSKRVRKPKDFGPEMAVQTLLGQRLVTQKVPIGSKAKTRKCVVSDGEKEYVVEIPKREPDDDYSSSLGMSNEFETLNKSTPLNTARFNHLLGQTAFLEDTHLVNCPNGVLGYMPDSEITSELSKIESQANVSGIPPCVVGKYNLDSQFEATYCSVPTPLEHLGNSTLMTMGSGLHKLAQNAVIQTRLAIYDKLFTKLGIGMADEALGILSQLCGKVTQVTEISQEDLTNDLQTAQDTIQALKDVLEELGIMSKDALSTAAHQRNISVTSLEKAQSYLKKSVTSPEDPIPTKRRKFMPFSHSKVVDRPTINLEPALVDAVRNDNSEALKVETFTPHVTNPMVMNVSSLSSALSATGMTPVLTVSAPHSDMNSVTDVSTTFIDVENKQYTIAPNMSLSGELLETLQNQKDGGIIELHVVKEAEDLVTGQGASVVHEVIHSPSIEVGVAETPSVECE